MQSGEMDFAYGDDGEDWGEAQRLFRARNPGVTIEVIKDWGPAGGFPVVRLNGSRKNVAKALDEWDCGDAEENALHKAEALGPGWLVRLKRALRDERGPVWER